MLKLALGTVQFGLKYGINNISGVPTDVELESILRVAKKSGIELLDSAQGYGDAEERLGKFSDYDFQVITKFKKLESGYPFHEELRESLNKLNTECVYGYMAHDGDLLIENPKWWQGLQEAKTHGLVKKIGYSLYSVNQLESLLSKKMIPDLIQFPYNIFDQRFAPHMSELVSLGVEIHTRSVYLQGLLQMNPEKLSNNLEQLKPNLKKLRDIAVQNNLSISELCLGFALSNQLISKVVIGVDNASQLAENIYINQKDSLSKEIISELHSIEVTELNLLNPSNWN
jgi:aryl-alcohol dehydrogenase-like predicted oxidoreductase